jgi:hypothetical protein
MAFPFACLFRRSATGAHTGVQDFAYVTLSGTAVALGVTP